MFALFFNRLFFLWLPDLRLIGKSLSLFSLHNVKLTVIFYLIVLGIFFTPLYGQDFSRVAPKQPEKIKELGSISTSSSPTVEQSSNQELLLIPHFRGLVLWKSSLEMKFSGLHEIHHLKTTIPLHDQPALERLLEPFWEKPLTQKNLPTLIQLIENYFREKEMTWVLAMVEEQKITEGILQIVVLPGKVGKITMKGNRWFSTQELIALFGLKPGDLLDQKRMNEELDYFNQNTFRQADLYLTPGNYAGKSDIQLNVKDRFPLRVYSGYENTGNNLTGNDRWFTGFNWGDAFFQGHQANYQFTTDGFFNRFESHTGSYSIPLPWMHQRLDLFGGFSQADGNSGDFVLTGKSWQTSARYRIPLPKLREVKQEVSLGADFKQSNNNLEFGGSSVFNHNNDVFQIVGEYEGNLADSIGSTRWNTKIFYSPGEVTQNNRSMIFNQSRLHARAEYVYGQGELERKFILPWGLSTRHSAQIQWSNGNLLGSEQFGLGGRESVRGYNEREANGDEGVLFQNELISPVGSASRFLNVWGISGLDSFKDRLQGLVFWDYGMVHNRILLPQEDREKILSSVGIGIRYSINSYLNYRADYGVQLSDSNSANRESYRIHMSLVLSY